VEPRITAAQGLVLLMKDRPVVRGTARGDMLQMSHTRRETEGETAHKRMKAPTADERDSGDQVRNDLLANGFRGRSVGVALVRSPCRLCAPVIDVIAEAHDLGSGRAFSLDRRGDSGEDSVPRLNVAHHIGRMSTLRRADLRQSLSIMNREPFCRNTPALEDKSGR